MSVQWNQGPNVNQNNQNNTYTEREENEKLGPVLKLGVRTRCPVRSTVLCFSRNTIVAHKMSRLRSIIEKRKQGRYK